MEPETFIWLVLPLVGTVAAAVYAARRDSSFDERLRLLERCEAHRQGQDERRTPSEGVTLDTPLVTAMSGQIAANTQTIGGLIERVEILEEI